MGKEGKAEGRENRFLIERENKENFIRVTTRVIIKVITGSDLANYRRTEELKRNRVNEEECARGNEDECARGNEGKSARGNEGVYVCTRGNEGLSV